MKPQYRVISKRQKQEGYLEYHLGCIIRRKYQVFKRNPDGTFVVKEPVVQRCHPKGCRMCVARIP